MYTLKKASRQYLLALWSFALGLPFVVGDAVVQGSTPQPVKRRFVRAPTTPRLTVSAAAGAVVVRGDDGSEALPMVRNLAQVFPTRDKLDVTFDDHASFGRFCDDDNPFHVVIEKGSRTKHDQWCLQRRFPADTAQPGEFIVGQFRTVFVVNRSNSIRSLDFTGIRKTLSQPCKGAKWCDAGGVGESAVRCYGSAERTWPRQMIQDKCMTRWRDTVPPGGKELQKLGFRNDIVVCEDAKEVIEKVRRDRNGLGFFAIGEELTDQMLRGVKVLPIAAKEGEQAVAPTMEAIIDGSYPLAEPVYLYVHPNAPKEAWDFCRFATGPEAAKIVKQSGLWPEHDLEQIVGKQRLADLRKGRGATIKVRDLAHNERLLNDLAGNFIKAKAAVRLNIQGGDNGEVNNQIIEGFFTSGSELVLADSNQWSAASGQGPTKRELEIKRSKSVVIGRMVVGVIVHPKNVLEALPLNELQGVFCGEIKQWPGANKSAGTMHVHGLQYGDPISRLLSEKIGGTAMPLKYEVESDTAKVVLAVAKDPFAIGFVDLSQLSPNEKSVKVVNVYEGREMSVGGHGSAEKSSPSAAQPPNAKQIAKQKAPVARTTSLGAYQLPEDYPLARTFTLYVSPQAGETAKDFAQFVTSERCAETLSKHNLLPQLYTSVSSAGRETTSRDRSREQRKPYLSNKR